MWPTRWPASWRRPGFGSAPAVRRARRDAPATILTTPAERALKASCETASDRAFQRPAGGLPPPGGAVPGGIRRTYSDSHRSLVWYWRTSR